MTSKGKFMARVCTPRQGTIHSACPGWKADLSVPMRPRSRVQWVRAMRTFSARQIPRVRLTAAMGSGPGMAAATKILYSLALSSDRRGQAVEQFDERGPEGDE